MVDLTKVKETIQIGQSVIKITRDAPILSRCDSEFAMGDNMPNSVCGEEPMGIFYYPATGEYMVLCLKCSITFITESMTLPTGHTCGQYVVEPFTIEKVTKYAQAARQLQEAADAKT